MSDAYTPRSKNWRWYVCGLLFLATMINYFDRQTVPVAAPRIQAEFKFNNERYGTLEFAFGMAFAAGGLTCGVLADRFGVFVIYPVILVLWSMMGILTGFVQNYDQLLLCRTLLGFFQAGHWPCALKTTQRILARKDRGMGNSMMQAGTSIGAVAVPLLMDPFLTDEPGSWRGPIIGIGAVGMVWIFLWLSAITPRDLAAPPPADDPTTPGAAPASDPGGDKTYWQVIFSPRYAVLIAVVVSINLCWHLFRVWLPKYLQYESGHAYSEAFALRFTALFYCVTAAGCFTSGAAMLFLARRGLTVHHSRLLVFGICALLTTVTTIAVMLPTGWLFLTMLLIVGFGSLGLFPCYYSFAQELSHRHQGRVSGLLTVFAWVVPALIHPFFGAYIDRTQSYDLGIALVGWAPLASLVPLCLFWNWSRL